MSSVGLREEIEADGLSQVGEWDRLLRHTGPGLLWSEHGEELPVVLSDSSLLYTSDDEPVGARRRHSSGRLVTAGLLPARSVAAGDVDGGKSVSHKVSRCLGRGHPTLHVGRALFDRNVAAPDYYKGVAVVAWGGILTVAIIASKHMSNTGLQLVGQIPVSVERALVANRSQP